ncbi:Ig-like domain-containing protein [Pseudocitrobacter faecalis]
MLDNDAGAANGHVTEVNGVAVAANGTTTINGLYGTLTIDAQGHYTYTLKSGLGADSIKTPDTFVYTVTAANGDTSTASLNVQPTAKPVDAVNDTSSTMALATNQVTSSYTDTSVGSATIAQGSRSATGVAPLMWLMGRR